MQPESIPSDSKISSRDWRYLWRHAIRSPRALLDLLDLRFIADRLSEQAMAQFPMRVPWGFARRMRAGDPHDPLLRQVLPIHEETALMPGFALDPVGDQAAAVADIGILKKYAGRALLIATGSCAVHCRYCFRRHFPYAARTAARNRWQDTIEWLRADPTIEEVILSGGDPLSLSTSKLEALTRQLRSLAHIKRLRIHTRLPIVLPERVDAGLLQWLSDLPWTKTIVVHANHANEFDAEVVRAMADLRQANVTLLNQAVLLRGVNDTRQALTELSERGYAAGVLPYYLHQLDRTQGAAHFEVPDEKARRLHAELAASLSGYLVPRLVRETAGRPGKEPL